MKEKYPSACCSPLKHVNRKMRRRKEGASRGSRSKGETLRQPSWGDGTRTAQSVSLTTLPDTGWLTQNHTLFSKYQETVQLRTHTNTHRQILVEHAVLRQTAWYIAMQTLILGENTCASFFLLQCCDFLPFLLNTGVQRYFSFLATHFWKKIWNFGDISLLPHPVVDE